VFFVKVGFKSTDGSLLAKSFSIFVQEPMLLWISVLPIFLIHVIYLIAFILSPNPEVRVKLMKRLKGI
jgi:hypothetical protein